MTEEEGDNNNKRKKKHSKIHKHSSFNDVKDVTVALQAFHSFANVLRFFFYSKNKGYHDENDM